MGKTAFIYPGQGAQKIGMGKDFYENSEAARQIYDMAEELLDFSVRDTCFLPNDRLHRTAYTQPCLVTTCLAMTQELLKAGLQPDLTAGLSLGEYAAIGTAGAMTAKQAIPIVRRRGCYMEEAFPDGKGGMTAVLGLPAQTVERILEPLDGVTVAYHCPGQTVITGVKEGLAKAADRLSQEGARRIVPLAVSGPFHSSYMDPAGERLKRDLQQITLSSLKIPYVTNVTGEMVTDSRMIPDLLVRQVSCEVRFEQSVRHMIEAGTELFVEIGPGHTLSGFVKRIDSRVGVRTVSTYADVKTLLQEIGR